MSNLKDAIKTLITEGTKKRYWPSKNPIDDPADFPGEKNFEEEEEHLLGDTENRFLKSDLVDSIVPYTEAGDDPASTWLTKLESHLQQHRSSVITRSKFQEILNHRELKTDLDVKGILDKVFGANAKELYTAKVGPYGSMKGEEENEYGQDQGAMYQNDDEYYDERDPRRQSNLCGSCEGDGCHLCNYTGEYEDEEHTEDKRSEFEKRLGLPYMSPEEKLASRKKTAEEQAGKVMRGIEIPGKFRSRYDLIPKDADPKTYGLDGEENEEHTDCMRCGNTGYTMDDGKICPDCPEGKAEREEFQRDVDAGIRVPTENEEDSGIIYPDKKPEWSKNSELMPHVGGANKERAMMRHAARMQQSGDKYWSTGSNQQSEENEEHKDCHQCGNTGFDLGTNKPCASCPEGEYERDEASKRASQRTFKQMFPTDKK